MPAVPDEDAFAAGLRMPADFQVHLGHQRTGGIEYPEIALPSLLVHGKRHAMRAVYHRAAVRYLAQFIDEHRAARTQAIHHVAVMHHLVAHVDRRAEQLQRALDDLDGAIDAGTEAARIGKQDFHGLTVYTDRRIIIHCLLER